MIEHAAARGRVQLYDGRYGTLVSWPGAGMRKRNSKARVLLPNGRYVSVDVRDVFPVPG